MKHQHIATRVLITTVLAAAAALTGACTMNSQDTPALTGPSGFGTSIDVTATPDAITQDGASQSLIVVTARGSNGQPLTNTVLRTAISVGGVTTDFGQLSAKTIVTGNDGRASMVYTAPGAVAGDSVDSNTIVTIEVTPSGTDYANASTRIVSIRLLPVGFVLPPNGTPTADFTMSPASVTEGVDIQFDASSSRDNDGQIVSYAWSFGDGGTGSSVRVSRSYSSPGTYSVTLRVTDNRGLSASTTKTVSIGTGTNPSAAFTVSPSAVQVNQPAFFNAAPSTASSGRTIVSYEWSFGDGSTATGINPTHAFTTGGTYAVTLTVTDDIGKKNVSSQFVAVSTSSELDPVARLTVSPSQAAVNAPVRANASTSTTQPGRTITRYDFNFGDGSPLQSSSNPVATHSYATTGSYQITLTITDSANRTHTISSPVTVGSNAPPVPIFVYSPQSPVGVNTTVTFDASASQAPQNGTITQYQWRFEGLVDPVDSTVKPGGAIFTTTAPTINFAYSAPQNYYVFLTVFDNQGGSATIFRAISVR